MNKKENVDNKIIWATKLRNNADILLILIKLKDWTKTEDLIPKFTLSYNYFEANE